MLHRAEAAPTLRRRRELDLGRIPGLRRGRLSIASTCRPAHAAPVRSDQPSTIFGAVTFLLAKNRPARSSPARLPPSRRKHTVLRATICSRIARPLYRGADRRMSPATSPWRLLSVGCRRSANCPRAASGKRKMQRWSRRSIRHITCAHALDLRGDRRSLPLAKSGGPVSTTWLCRSNEKNPCRWQWRPGAGSGSVCLPHHEGATDAYRGLTTRRPDRHRIGACHSAGFV